MTNNGLNLGQLIDELKKHPGDAHVTFDFGGLAPDCLDSYRGYYEDLALGFSTKQMFGEPEHTVKALLERLTRAAEGEVFHGWKGGEYKADRTKTLWVAQSGETGNTIITGVKSDGENVVVIETAYEAH